MATHRLGSTGVYGETYIYDSTVTEMTRDSRRDPGCFVFFGYHCVTLYDHVLPEEHRGVT